MYVCAYVHCVMYYVTAYVHNISYQLTRQKSNSIFHSLKYRIERTGCSIQQVDYIE